MNRKETCVGNTAVTNNQTIAEQTANIPSSVGHAFPLSYLGGGLGRGPPAVRGRLVLLLPPPSQGSVMGGCCSIYARKAQQCRGTDRQGVERAVRRQAGVYAAGGDCTVQPN